MNYNGLMRVTLGHAGQVNKIHAGELVRCFPCSNLPAPALTKSVFVVSDSGIEIMADVDSRWVAREVKVFESRYFTANEAALWNLLIWFFSLGIKFSRL